MSCVSIHTLTGRWGELTWRRSFVVGPPLIAPTSPEAVGDTIRPIWTVFSGGPQDAVQGAVGFTVDVRDVASLLNYFVLHPRETDGERYIAKSSHSVAQSIADVLRKALPDARSRIVEGFQGQGYKADYQVDAKTQVEVDSSKAKKLLDGQEWIGYEKSVVDTAKSFVGLV